MLWEKTHMAGEQSRHFRILIHWALTPYKPYIFWRHGEACGRVSSTHVGQPSFFGSLEADTVTSPSQTSNPSNLVQQGAPSLCLWCLPPLAPLWSHSGAPSGSCAWSLTVLSFLLSHCPSCCWFSLFIWVSEFPFQRLLTFHREPSKWMTGSYQLSPVYLLPGACDWFFETELIFAGICPLLSPLTSVDSTQVYILV